jgi:hypothetical protein
MTAHDAASGASKRKVGFLLGVGIVFLPFVFAWFTLAKGHSLLSRLVSFLWMTIVLGATIGGSGPASNEQNKLASSISAAGKEQRGATPSPESNGVPNEASSATNWRYAESRDEMRGTVIKTASINSKNEVEFDFPYSGGSFATILVRRREQDGLQIMFQVSKGQFMCNSFSSTSINVKFDDGAIQKFGCAETSSGQTDAIFLTNSSRFLTALETSQMVTVEAEFFQHGMAQFTFDSAGLKFD